LKNLLFFSYNQNKIIEVKNLFKHNKIKILDLNQYAKVDEPIESGLEFVDNAKIKSKYGYKKFCVPCFADDSGICISALKNKPGVRSKRFFNKFKSKSELFRYIINKTRSSKNTVAYFKTSICLTIGLEQYIVFEGQISGNIASKPKGKNGFGYDPIFIPEGYSKTFAEMKNSQKNSLSHRALAINKLKNFLFN